MNNEILDLPEDKRIENYSRQSFFNFLKTIGSFFLLGAIHLSNPPIGTLIWVKELSMGLILIYLVVFLIRGIRATWQSIVKREKINFFKIAGMIGNGLFGGLFFLLIFSIATDIKRVFF